MVKCTEEIIGTYSVQPSYKRVFPLSKLLFSYKSIFPLAEIRTEISRKPNWDNYIIYCENLSNDPSFIWRCFWSTYVI